MTGRGGEDTVPRSGIDKNAIKRMFRDIQKEFDKNGPIRVPIEIGPTLSGEVFPGLGSSTYGEQVIQGDVSALDLESSAIRLMDWLYSNSDGVTYLDIDTFLEQNDEDTGKAFMLGKHLDRNGWANVAFSLGTTSAILTSEGVARVERVGQIRNNRAARAADLQRQMVTWLYEKEDEGSAPETWDEFLLQKPAHLLGEAFAEAEVRRQAAFLDERKLISSTRIEEETDGWLGPKLTASGLECVVHYQGEVSTYVQRGNQRAEGHHYYGAVVQGNADGAQFAWGNQTVTQVSGGHQVTAGYEELATTITAILQNLPRYELPENDQADVGVVATEILAEVVLPAPNQGKIRRACAAIKGFLSPIAIGASAGAGEGAQELARQAIESLGATF